MVVGVVVVVVKVVLVVVVLAVMVLVVVIVVLAGEGSWRNGVYTIAWMGWMVVVVEEKM